jgi:hypothetical protein
MTLGSRVYSHLLVLYPDELRRDFGADMALVFAEDLDTARRKAGLPGVIRVWQCALCEFLRFALPRRASSPAVRVPAISLALFLAVVSGEMTLALRRTADAATLFQAVFTALWLPLFATPIIALAAVWACRGRAVILLDLSGNTDEEH